MLRIKSIAKPCPYMEACRIRIPRRMRQLGQARASALVPRGEDGRAQLHLLKQRPILHFSENIRYEDASTFEARNVKQSSVKHLSFRYNVSYAAPPPSPLCTAGADMLRTLPTWACTSLSKASMEVSLAASSSCAGAIPRVRSRQRMRCHLQSA